MTSIRRYGLELVGSDRGSATLVVVGLIGLLVLAGFIASVLAMVLGAQANVAEVADLSALSAADRVLDGPDKACSAARELGRRAGMRVVDCRLDGLDAQVVISRRLFAADGPEVTATSRAGPP